MGREGAFVSPTARRFSRLLLVVLVVGLFAGLIVGAVRAPTTTATTGPSGPPPWKLTYYKGVGYDRSFKADLVEYMPVAPRVVVFGGSRSLRMDPATIKQETGLPAFNAGFHNGRGEDAWAFLNFLMERRPRTHLRVVWCVQSTYFGGSPPFPGLILEQRLSRYLAPEFVAANLAAAKKERFGNLMSDRRYGPDGMLWWNHYDTVRARGLTLDRALDNYLDSDMMARASSGKLPNNTASMEYFEKSLALLNDHGVKPLIVLMPLHPRVLQAFLAVGWGVKEQWLHDYLASLHGRYDFKVLDCLKISTFGGKPDGFYDGSHLTAENSRRLIRYAVRKAPECFAPWSKSVTPPPAPSAAPSN
jgi:hypothetical protein